VGDFNLPQIKWATEDPSALDNPSAPLIDLANLLHLRQINKIKNALGVHLDLVFATNLNVTHSVDLLVLEEGHHPALDIAFPLKLSPSSASWGSHYDYRRCDLNGVFDWIQQVQLPVSIDLEDVEASFNAFWASLSSVVKYFTPVRSTRARIFPKWFSPELKNAIIRKKALHRRYKETLDDYSYQLFRHARSQCQQLTKACLRNHMSQVEASMKQDIRLFWRYFKDARRSTSIPEHMYLDNESVHGFGSICQLFANHFASVYNAPQGVPPDYDYGTSVALPCSFSCVEVEHELLGLNCNKGTGPDGVPPIILKYYGSVLAPLMSVYFNSLFSAGIFPSCLKEGVVTSIYKCGDQSDIKNYRPVVIQSAAAKVQIIFFTSSRSPLKFDYFIDSTTVSRVDRVRDLGVILLSSDLSAGGQVEAVCRKANTLLGSLVRVSRDHFSVDALRTLFVHLVRPVLEFSSTAWTPHQAGHWEMMERIQRRFIRLVGLKMGFLYTEMFRWIKCSGL